MTRADAPLEPHRSSAVVAEALDRLLEETATMTSRIKLSAATAKSEVSSPAFLSFTAVLLASILLLGGCNTAEGVGDDVEEAGEEIGDAID
jgi:predicted small secreted protein